MPPTPLSFAKRVFYLIVLSRRRIEPSRCGRTDRPPHSYKIRIAKFHNAPTKFLGVESRRGRHDRFYCGDSESESELVPVLSRIGFRQIVSRWLSLTTQPRSTASSGSQIQGRNESYHQEYNHEQYGHTSPLLGVRRIRSRKRSAWWRCGG